MRAKTVNEDIGARKSIKKEYPAEVEPLEYVEKPKRPQRPFVEIKGITGDDRRNAQLYEGIVERHPFVKTIAEDIFHIVPSYGLWQIQEDGRGVTLWCGRARSMGAYFNDQTKMDLLIDHKVSFQVPGNQDYAYSLSINYEKEW